MNVDNIVERIDGYHGWYTDKHGQSCEVRGTYAIGPTLSWYDEHGNYMVICGADQGKTVQATQPAGKGGDA